MIHPQIKYFVILRAGLQESEQSFLCKLGQKVAADQDGGLLRFDCIEVDVSHHNYIEAKILIPDQQKSTLMRIPHYLVLMILDASDPPNPIGFPIH